MYSNEDSVLKRLLPKPPEKPRRKFDKKENEYQSIGQVFNEF